MPTTQKPKAAKGLGSYARLHDFVQKKKGEREVDYEQVFKRMITHLKKQLKGTILFEMQDKLASYSLNLDESLVKRSAVNSLDTVEKSKSNFHVIAQSDALENILSGKNSPIIAMAKGQLAFHGDTELGKSFYKQLAADNGKTDPCI